MIASPESARERDTGLGLIVAVMTILFLFTVLAIRYRQPLAQPADAPINVFSAQRALDRLRVVLGDETPHPIGSAANRLVRDRIVTELKQLGYEPEIQTGYACDQWDQCATVENIVTRIEGREAGAAVALSSHYDSVGAGPGATDDGIGVATTLEIARILKAASSPPRHSIILLMTDGEELALLGARVFVDEHRWASEVAATVNLDARGNTGPAFMFETGSHNAALIELFAASAVRPVTNSIYYAAYKRLPNDTDFTVFQAAGWQGFNYALTGRVQHYHTPLDRIANLSPGSLQHMGNGALATLIALADSDLKVSDANTHEDREGDAVYVDLFSAVVLAWPVSVALPAAIATALLWLAIFVTQLRKACVKRREIVIAGIVVVIALALTALTSAGLVTLLQIAGAMPPASADYSWPAHPLPILIAQVALVLVALSGMAVVLARRVSVWSCWSAISLWLVIATVASASTVPALGSAFQLPAFVMLVSALPWLFVSVDRQWLRILPALLPAPVCTIILVPSIALAYPSLGPRVLPVLALLLLWSYLPLVVLVMGARASVQRGLLAIAAAALLIATTAAALQAPYTSDSPQRLNFEYAFDADAGRAEWRAVPDSGVLPQAIAEVLPFSTRTAPIFPWDSSAMLRADAPLLETPPPTLRVRSIELADAGMRIKGELVSPRGAQIVQLCFAPGSGVSAVVVNGLALPEPTAYRLTSIIAYNSGWRCLQDFTLSPSGLAVEFTVPTQAGIEVLISDRSNGLPAAGRSLIAARPPDAVPSQDGDVTCFVRRQRIRPP